MHGITTFYDPTNNAWKDDDSFDDMELNKKAKYLRSDDVCHKPRIQWVNKQNLRLEDGQIVSTQLLRLEYCHIADLCFESSRGRKNNITKIGNGSNELQSLSNTTLSRYTKQYNQD